jgi:CIC family chloride channel protein
MVGMGAVLAGAAHAPMTATLLLFEMTQDYGILLPTLLATGISTIASRAINPESVYTAPLAREGIRLREGRDVNLMEAVRVEEAMAEEWVAVEADLPIAELGGYFDQQGVDSLLVVDDRGALLGAVTASA